MVYINKDEKDAICKRYPNVHIVRTMKGDSHRHHYYCEETKGVRKLLETLRNTNSFTKDGAKC